MHGTKNKITRHQEAECSMKHRSSLTLNKGMYKIHGIEGKARLKESRIADAVLERRLSVMALMLLLVCVEILALVMLA